MKKNTRLLLLLCTIAIVGLLALQFYWLKTYYAVNKAGFEKEVNLAFEDAIKKEFSLRCDTIQQLIVEKLMDTSEFEITSKLLKDSSTNQYTITNHHDKKDAHSFSIYKINAPITGNGTTIKKKVAMQYALGMRSEDLDNHVVWYRTQNLGSFMDEKVKQYNFDTARLRPVLTRYLLQRNITVPFQFYLREDDSTMNKSSFPKALLARFPIITKSYPTYKLVDDSHYVRALFTDPFSYIVSKMCSMFFSSLVLIILVLVSIFLLIKSLFREKKLSAIKNDFINHITHEFKTPIATISAAVEALSDFDVLRNKEKTQRYLAHSKNELERLSKMVDKILNLAIYENQQQPLKYEQINIKETVEAIVQSHLISAVKEIDFTYENDTGIRFIKADKIQFHHAINNIIDNAIKYSDKKVAIKIGCSIHNNFLLLSIHDNGNGIDASETKLVFEKFYRANTSNRHLVKGYGLGLNYVKNIIEQHGGWCSLQSKLGNGSVISLAWPI